MNTLSRALTAQTFPHSETYLALQKCWSNLINSERKHELTAAHHLLYLALLGKDWRKGFTPPTNLHKLENGAFQGWVLFQAFYTLHAKYREVWLLAPFGGLVTPLMLAQIRQLLPLRPFHTYLPEQFKDHIFPFAAYELPEVAQAKPEEAPYA